MSQPPADSFKYVAPVDRDAPNNAHAFALHMIGRDKRVLELGCSAGYVTQALVDQGCSVVGVEYDSRAAAVAAEIADEVVVADLSDPGAVTKIVDGREFDVVYAGDVLEHLPNPVGVLAAARAGLRPGGCAVLSLPNIAHVDVKLSLLAGHFDYRETGLLDETHLRFFTRASISRLVEDSGFFVTDIRRVVLPAFKTEIGMQRHHFDPAVVAAALADPEAETYQFVVRAVRDDFGGELERASVRFEEVDRALGEERIRREQLESEVVELRAELDRHVEALRQAMVAHDEALEAFAGAQATAEAAREHLDAILATKTFRATSFLRRSWGRLRGRP